MNNNDINLENYDEYAHVTIADILEQREQNIIINKINALTAEWDAHTTEIMALMELSCRKYRGIKSNFDDIN